MEPRRAPRSDTRDRILDAAFDLFDERGVTGTSVSDIERAVGLAGGGGSFYRHFPSKDALVVPAVERRLRRLLHRLEEDRAALPPVDDRSERFRRDAPVRLHEMRTILPVWVLVQSERARFPELLDVFTETVGMSQWGDLGWFEDPTNAIVLATLTGYSQLVAMGKGFFAELGDEEFIGVLAAWVDGAAGAG